MSRYTGPAYKKSRRVSFSTLENGKDLAKRPYKPGQHGQDRKAKASNYSVQLQEKQKLRFMYGISEKQFERLVNESAKMKGVHGENLFILLESRLDNLVYRAGFAATRAQARQLVNHGHFLVDGKKVDIPSYRLQPGQVITLKETSKDLKVVKEALEAKLVRCDYVAFDENKMAATFVRFPERNEFLPEVNEQLIVEFYSR